MNERNYGFGDNTDFIREVEKSLIKQKEEFDLLDYGVIVMNVSESLYDYLSSDQHEKLVKNIRKSLREEEGILFPVISCSVEYDDDVIGDNDIMITINGSIKKGWEIDPVFFDEREDELYDAADNLSFDIIDMCARFFEAFDLEEEAEKLIRQKEVSSENYKQLLNYYRLINPDKKKYFHYMKKLAALGIPRYMYNLRSLYNKGEGCEKNELAGEKVVMTLDKRESKKYYWY